MANPFDQFDNAPLPSAMDPSSPTSVPAVAPGETLPAGEPPSDNPFNAPRKPDAQLSQDEFSSQLYRRLNNGDRPDEILAWSEEMGFPIRNDEAFIANLAERDRALSEGRQGTYGRTQVLQQGQPASGDTLAGFGAMLRKAGNVPLFYFGDEATAAGAALASDKPYWDAYEENWRRLNARDQLDEAIHPVESTIGEGIGMVLSMRAPGAIYDRAVRQIAPKVTSRAANIAVRSGVGAATGAASGATAGLGEGSVDDRTQFVDDGALLGGLVGSGFPLVAEGLGRLARPIRERLFANSGRAMGDRMGLTNEELAAMEAELKRQTGMGLDPTLLDVLPERARKVIGSAGAHDDAAEALQDVASGRRVQLPERVQRQADEVILPEAPVGVDPALMRSPSRMTDALNETRRADLDAAMEPIRREVVPMSDEVAQVLATKQGQAAIRDAIGMELDPVLRDQMARLGEVAQLLENIDPRLPEAARNQIMRQIMVDAPFTVNASDKISRALNGRVKGEGADAMVLGQFARTVRDAAKTNPAYAAAMERAAAQHGAREAVELGQQALKSNNVDEFVEGAGALPNQSTAQLPSGAGRAELEPLDDAMRGAARVQTAGDDYFMTGVEQYLRNPEGFAGTPYASKEAVVSYLTNMERMIKNSPLATPTALYRGSVMTADELASLTDDGLHMRKPLSFSADRKVAQDYADSDPWMTGDPDLDDTLRSVVFEIDAPQGAFAASVDDISGDPLKEFVLSGRLPVKSTRQEGNVTVVTLDEAAMERLPTGTPGTPAPSNRDLARIGAAEATRDRAGQGPAEAKSTAEQFYDSPGQRRRTDALVGGEKAQELADRMKGEVDRVYRAAAQASREAPAREGGIQGAENFANAMYQPGSPIPWIREITRFVHRIGMTEKDAKWIVDNGTDPAKTSQLITMLERHGVQRDKAVIYAQEVRDALVKYLSAQEGGSE